MYNAIAQMILNNGKQSSFANILTATDPVAVKKSRATKLTLNETFPGHSSIVKIGSRNVSLGNKYATAVNNRLEKAGVDNAEFVAAPREWLERIEGTPLCQHKESGQLYVEYFYLNANKSTAVYQWEDGTTLTEEELTKAKEFFSVPSKSIKQIDAGLTEEETVKINIVKIDNVVSLKAWGEYTIA